MKTRKRILPLLYTLFALISLTLATGKPAITPNPSRG
jgi:hypothetical protein